MPHQRTGLRHLDMTTSEELAAAALGVASLLVTDKARLPGHYAAPIPVPAGAPPSVRLLAAAGRQ
jgi:hypothetical protein